jgi:hypothetical protein
VLFLWSCVGLRPPRDLVMCYRPFAVGKAVKMPQENRADEFLILFMIKNIKIGP